MTELEIKLLKSLDKTLTALKGILDSFHTSVTCESNLADFPNLKRCKDALDSEEIVFREASKLSSYDLFKQLEEKLAKTERELKKEKFISSRRCDALISVVESEVLSVGVYGDLYKDLRSKVAKAISRND